MAPVKAALIRIPMDREGEMLTYRTGAAGAPSAARSMGEHLLQQTLPPEMAAMAEYYEQGVAPPTAAAAAASRYGPRRTVGARFAGPALDGLVAEEIARLGDIAPRDGSDRDERETWRATLAFRALGAFLAADLVVRDEALAALTRLDHDADQARLDAAAEKAIFKDYSSAVASPRRDMNPALAARLGIVPSRIHISSEDGDGGQFSADLRANALTPETAHLIDKALRRIVGVRQVIAVSE